MGKTRVRAPRTKAAVTKNGNPDVEMGDDDSLGYEEPGASKGDHSEDDFEEGGKDMGMYEGDSEDEDEEGIEEGDDVMEDGDSDVGIDPDEDDEDEDDVDVDDDEEEDDAGVAIPSVDTASISIPPSLTSAAAAADTTIDGDPSLNPQKPIPYIHDAGHLLISDANPLPFPSTTTTTTTTTAAAATLESTLQSITRDAAQSLITHLLRTCPIRHTRDGSTSTSGVEMVLPPPDFAIPREKKVPTPKTPTKWETFAKKRGIGKFAGHRGSKMNATDAEGRLQAAGGKMVYDEAKGEWVRKWGYKGKNKDGEADWLVEVNSDDDGGKKGDPRGAKRAERKDRVRRNERAMRANERRSRSGRPA